MTDPLPYGAPSKGDPEPRPPGQAGYTPKGSVPRPITPPPRPSDRPLKPQWDVEETIL